MSDFGKTVMVKGRKDHRCIACYETIPKGEPHAHYKGIWGGEFQDWRMHDECHKAMPSEDMAEGFEPGEYPRPKPKPDSHLGAVDA